MPSILVQAQTDNVLTATRLKRVSSRSLDTFEVVGGELTNVLEHKKPMKRPEK